MLTMFQWKKGIIYHVYGFKKEDNDKLEMKTKYIKELLIRKREGLTEIYNKMTSQRGFPLPGDLNTWALTSKSHKWAGKVLLEKLRIKQDEP